MTTTPCIVTHIPAVKLTSQPEIPRLVIVNDVFRRNESTDSLVDKIQEIVSWTDLAYITQQRQQPEVPHLVVGLDNYARSDALTRTWNYAGVRWHIDFNLDYSDYPSNIPSGNSFGRPVTVHVPVTASLSETTEKVLNRHLAHVHELEFNGQWPGPLRARMNPILGAAEIITLNPNPSSLQFTPLVAYAIRIEVDETRTARQED